MSSNRPPVPSVFRFFHSTGQTVPSMGSPAASASSRLFRTRAAATSPGLFIPQTAFRAVARTGSVAKSAAATTAMVRRPEASASIARSSAASPLALPAETEYPIPLISRPKVMRFAVMLAIEPSTIEASSFGTMSLGDCAGFALARSRSAQRAESAAHVMPTKTPD